MNLKHPYEKHLAEKLVQLPPPGDPDQNWQQMSSLLDKNMPRGGGSAGGSYRWWIAGTVIVAVMVGTWFGGKQLLTKDDRNEAVAGTIKTVNNNTAPTVASTGKKEEQPATKYKNLPGAAYASTPNTPNDDGAVVNNAPPAAVPPAASTTGKSEPVTHTDAAKARSSGNNTITPLPDATNDNNRAVAAATTNPDNNNKIVADRKNVYSTTSKNRNKGTSKTNTTNNDSHRATTSNGNKRVVDEGVTVMNGSNNNAANKTAKNHIKRASAGANKGQSVKDASAGTPYTYTPTILPPRRSLPSQPSEGSGLKESPVNYNINYTAGTIISPSVVIQQAFTYYTPVDEFRDKALAKKKATARKSNPFSTNEDKRFAVGLSLPLGFPIGDQQPLAYNSNAGVNTISDYIPSPHFQYHFNNKTYVQAGLQFKAPQFIHPLLLYQDNLMYQQGPNLIEQVTYITARKLYYFNLPLTVYHSPLKNFYMGAGLQYSSLLSGVAFYEKIEKKYSAIGPPQEYLVKNYFTKFKNDSLSNRLNGNEVRLLVDMSYYWSRFTVGLQYSQAFNNYVSFQVTPQSPYTFDKNKSLQFYLRYNIWEDKKRKQPKDQPVLTLK